MNHYQKKTTRIIRTLIGASLLLYIFTNAKMEYWLPFYTFQTNVFVGLWYLFSGLLPGKEKPSFLITDSFKGAITTYITITGLVYNLVLIPVEIAYVGYIPFVSVVTHMIVPVMMVTDFIITPPVKKPQWKKLPLWLTYPIVYAAITLLNGAINDFYPYPFIDPGQVNTTAQLVFNYIALFLIHLGLAGLYFFIARKKWQKTNN